MVIDRRRPYVEKNAAHLVSFRKNMPDPNIRVFFCGTGKSLSGMRPMKPKTPQKTHGCSIQGL
jgi:hypothetical protein